MQDLDLIPMVDAVQASGLVLHISAAAKVNFATAQNGVAVIKDLSIENLGPDAVESVRLHLTARPAILREKTWVIDRIAAGSSVRISDLETPLDPVMLSGLDEAEFGQLAFHLSADGLEDVTVMHPIEMLARDEWGGLAEMDNILAAYVSPNQPYVARILKEASRLLEAAGQSGAIDGYQTGDAGRVWMLAGAIWSAATGLGLSYAVPPASFERIGQKVRDPERICAEGLATCLDSTLLLAAAFEAAGLNAAVLFSQGHAWVGVWLIKKDFGRLVEPDVVAVRKASVAREFVPLETTLVTKRPAIGFQQAVDAGRDRLSEAREAEFVEAVDINRARAARIRPLASHRQIENAPADAITAAPAALPRPLDLGLLPGEITDETPTTALGRIERWQRKLLDLSLSNRLLNFRDTKGAVPMLCPDISRAEDRLADGEQFRLLALKDENATTGRDLPPEEARQIEIDLARDAFDRGQIAVPLTSRDMTTRLTELYRKARSDLAEGGTNTLFLAVGFLRWKRTEGDTRTYRAPLILLPAKLERRSAQSEFRLSQLEDEVRINSTLLELLKRDFELRIPELEGDLPRDESGIDIYRIMEILRQRVRDVAGFEVVEEFALSTFSFAKYLMWKDLVDRTDSLRESRLVAHLVDSPTEVFPGSRNPLPRPADVDRKHAPADILAPLPADSSQLAAVLAAGAGHDFVLIGPPGTGKSQTITNIIADQLGRGRTVLFVAEKSAALDVVHRRLERHGLGDAVLELHSNKADRKKVLAQLGRSWERATEASAQEWVRIAEDLRLTRDELNAYVDALHRPGTQGFSVYQAIGKVAGGAPGFALNFDNKDCHDQASWRHLRGLAAELGTRHGIVADIDPQGPLSLLDRGEWSFGWQDNYLEAAKSLRQSMAEARMARHRLGERLGLRPDEADAPDVAAALVWLADQRLGKPRVSEEALTSLATLRLSVDALEAAIAQAKAARATLAAQYPDSGLPDMPLDALELQWREAQAKSWPFAGMAKGKVTKLLQTYASTGKADPARDLSALKQLRRALADIAASPLRVVPGFAEEGSDLQQLRAELDAAEAFLALERHLHGAGIPAAWLEAHRPVLAAAAGGDLAPLLAALQTADAMVTTARARFEELGGDPGPEAADRLRGLESLQHRFSDWLKWRDSRARAIAAGLEPLVSALEAKADLADAAVAFEQAYMGWWLRLAMDAEPCLRGFAHWQHDALIRRFRELDDAMARLASSEVMRRLGNDLPRRDDVPRNSELGGLRHQLGLQRPTKAIRSLIGDMPTTFGKLAPCVLMSPLSVAQYLPAGQAQFDLVIFDEASQISTWDAIGAIARGRQAIIVGDPKQLPPTNFFGRSEDASDDMPGVEEFEKDMPSILDEVSAAGIPTHRLNWHYRSRDEALIAFSNHFYYDGGLVTFPSPDASGQAVRLHKVAGTYMRGQGRTNPDEARAIVTFIRKRLNEWLKLQEDCRPTLGVITFNAQQQGLILDLLDAERKATPDFEWFFSDEREEPLIVKNLENIQGDERDVMLFSITFGPDQAGKLTMNFGALNGDGGEKRLNVAVTRARSELHVFSSVTADQIDIGRARGRGVADLKAFLDFANRGAVALAAQDSGSLGPVESPFEEAVRDALALKGWEVHSQIGVSGFRIDLGVRHPDHAGVWLAGVECDGARYHSSATARDRDRIRQAVLEGLGWTILRIWSTDWFRAPQATLERIDGQLRAALESDRALRAEAVQKIADVVDEAQVMSAMESIPHDDTPHFASAPIDASALLDATTRAAQGTVSPERFFDADYTPTLLALLDQIVAENAPLTEANLARMVAQRHGWQRTGGRIQARIAELHSAFDLADEDGVRFVWAKGSIADRISFRGMGERALRDISRTEIAALIDVHAQRLASSEDPELELARLCGIARLSKDAREYLGHCRAWQAGLDASP
jgi:very-short-patch-repair endonuclease